MSNWRVVLSHKDNLYCKETAIFRLEVNKKINPNLVLDDKAYRDSLCGARAECGASNLFRIIWDDAQIPEDIYRQRRELPKLPDFGALEIKGTSNLMGPVWLSERDLNMTNAILIRAYVQAVAGSVEVRLTGWRLMRECDDLVDLTDHSRKFTLKSSHLHKMDKLDSFRNKLSICQSIVPESYVMNGYSCRLFPRSISSI